MQAQQGDRVRRIGVLISGDENDPVKPRDASVFFKDVFPGNGTAPRRKQFVGCLKVLQDVLGDLNDIRVNMGVTRDLVHRRSSKASGGSLAFTGGRVSGLEEARREAAMKTAGSPSYLTPLGG